MMARNQNPLDHLVESIRKIQRVREKIAEESRKIMQQLEEEERRRALEEQLRHGGQGR